MSRRITRPRRGEAMAKATSTTTNHSSFPKAIITGILSKLPVKSIVRFKCVSKSLYALIETLDFISTHLRRSAQNPFLLVRYYHHLSGYDSGLMLIDEERILGDVQLPPFQIGLSCFPRVVGSCNGLICLDVSSCFTSALALWNIKTRQFRHLPRPLFTYESPSRTVGMVSPGFGYNPDTDDYMVVRIVYFNNSVGGYESRAEVYKWSTGYWKEIRTDIFPSIVVYGGQEAVAMEGVLHWMANGIEELANCKFIVSFDMNQEAFRAIRMPKTSPESYIKALPYKGSLALAVYPGIRSQVSSFELWLLHDGKSWTEQASVALFPRIICPMGSWKDCQLIMKLNKEFLLVQLPAVITSSLPLCASEYTCKFYTYVDSLVSVHGEKENENEAVEQIRETHHPYGNLLEIN